jgi:outer membrane lipoprotein-sorting protein
MFKQIYKNKMETTPSQPQIIRADFEKVRRVQGIKDQPIRYTLAETLHDRLMKLKNMN